MLGAIAGDMIGVPWEALGEKRYDFPLFTEYSRFSDDTVMTLAVAHALLEGSDYAATMRGFGRRHPFIGYGAGFERWLSDDSMGPYNSYGNGRPTYNFDVAAERSVPEAIICFLDAQDFEGAVRNAVSLGGDADTMACIAGAIAEAHWGEIPDAIAIEVRKRLPVEFLDLLERFRARFERR
jgi:ADP-ribosylglycohydrolase